MRSLYLDTVSGAESRRCQRVFTIHHRQVSLLLQLHATSAEKLIKDIQLEKHPEQKN